MKYKEFWIKRGTNKFDYSFFDPEYEVSFDRGDQFYDKILEYPAKGGVHVIEKKAYDELQSKLDIAVEALEFVANDGYSSTSEDGVPDRSEFWNKARQALEKIR